MRQQVNLFLQIPREKVDISGLSIKRLLIICASIVGLYFCYTVYITIKDSNMVNQVATLTEESTAAKKAFDDLSAQYPDAAKEVIASQDKDIEQHIAVKKAILSLLKSNSLSTQGFTNKLDALSQVVEPGMWLTDIQFDLNNDYIGFSGLSNSAENLLKFVDNLGRNSAFNGKKFLTFKMDKPADATNTSVFTFILSNSLDRFPPTPTIPAAPLAKVQTGGASTTGGVAFSMTGAGTAPPPGTSTTGVASLPLGNVSVIGMQDVVGADMTTSGVSSSVPLPPLTFVPYKQDPQPSVIAMPDTAGPDLDAMNANGGGPGGVGGVGGGGGVTAPPSNPVDILPAIAAPRPPVIAMPDVVGPDTSANGSGTSGARPAGVQ